MPLENHASGSVLGKIQSNTISRLNGGGGKLIMMTPDKTYNDYKSYKGYKDLPFFRQAEIIYDFTVQFCQLHVDKTYKSYKGYKSYSRQSDQLIQAARSGKQNIAEGYLQKSIEGKLKLLGVARGSLEELLNDYLDHLRQHHLSIWSKDDPRSLAIRKIAYKNYKDYNDYKIYIRTPEEAANTMIILINQTNSLLDQKLRWTEDQFVKEGGFRENLLKKRLEYRKAL